jgi:ribosome-binding protein aMBF1 (putative translation factor)
MVVETKGPAAWMTTMVRLLSVPSRTKPPAYLQTVGTRITNARKAKGLTRVQLAEELGVSLNSVAQYEQGKTEPSLVTIIRLLATLGITFDQLTEGLLLPPGS